MTLYSLADQCGISHAEARRIASSLKPCLCHAHKADHLSRFEESQLRPLFLRAKLTARPTMALAEIPCPKEVALTNQLALAMSSAMTVQQVSEATGAPVRTIHDVIDRILPGIKRNGLTTYLDEAQVALVSAELKKAHNSDLAGTRKVASTHLELMDKAREIMGELAAETTRLRAEVALLAPRAEVADRIADSAGAKTLAEIGKITGIGPRRIVEELIARRILYRQGPTILPMQQHIEAGRFIVREKSFDMGGIDVLYSQTLVTGKGEVWLAGILAATA